MNKIKNKNGSFCLRSAKRSFIFPPKSPWQLKAKQKFVIKNLLHLSFDIAGQNTLHLQGFKISITTLTEFSVTMKKKRLIL